MKLEWNRLEKLRAPASLSVALEHLGLYRIFIVRKELRSEGAASTWIEIPMWLKGNKTFMERLEKNEVGNEMILKLRQKAQEECLYLQETVFKTNSLGLTEIVVPVVLRGERIGFIRTGGVVFDESQAGDIALEERFKILMLPENEMMKAKEEFQDLPHFGADKRAIVVQMLELLAHEIIQFFDESLASLEREEEVQKHTFSQMVTTHIGLKSTLKKLTQISTGDSSILIYGEPGTGRELLSRMVHERSARAKKEFRILHCSQVSENLVEAELFGYNKGAFPGAYSDKIGLLEVCNKGTIHLKEVSDLGLPMQLKLLRLLQEKSFSRLGSTDIIPADVRIITSTQRNLKKLIQLGTFRDDLYFHLNGLEIEIPPLRSRREDIKLLAEYFLHFFMKKMKKEGIQWKEGALAKLTSHPFAGNVRELQNEVERLVAVKESHSMIQVKDLNPKIAEMRSPVEELEKGRALKAIVDEFEREIISHAMLKYNWNKTRVANLFQITRQGLLKKIAKYRLDKRKRA